MPRWTPQMVTPKINSLLASGKLEYRAASRSWYYEKLPLSEREVSRRIAYIVGAPVCHAELAVQVRAQELSIDVRLLLQEWVRSLEAPTAALPRSVRLDPTQQPGDGVLRKFIELMQRDDTDEELTECHLWAMRQWVWQTKRNILGMPVTWHVTPIFWSQENGTGKSYNLNRLLAPVEKFTRHMAVDELGERFSKKLLSRTHVVVFEEFAKAGEADVATFKAMITGRPLEGREMYGEGGFYAENRLSCIATSNLPPPHNFEDSSGARRFWSIHCAARKPKPAAVLEGHVLQYQTPLDRLELADIWRCVSVEVPSLEDIIPHHILARMKAERQNRLRTKDSFELFADECLEAAEADVRTPFHDVIDAYRLWCVHSNHKRLKAGQQRTAERLEALGYRCVNSSNRRFLVGHRLRLNS